MSSYGGSSHWSRRMTVAVWLLTAAIVAVLIVTVAEPNWRFSSMSASNGELGGRRLTVADPLGLLVVDIQSDEQATQYHVVGFGVYVLAVNEDSQALRLGVQAGDRIVSVNGEPIADAAALTAFLQTAPSELHVVMRRSDAEYSVTLQNDI